MLWGRAHEVVTGWIQALKDNSVSSFGVKFNLALWIPYYETQEENIHNITLFKKQNKSY